METEKKEKKETTTQNPNGSQGSNHVETKPAQTGKPSLNNKNNPDKSGKKSEKDKNKNKQPNAKQTQGNGKRVANPKGCNDISWWMKDENIAKSACNLPFNIMTGIKFDLVGQDEIDVGIMRLRYIPTFGCSTKGSSSAINIAARKIYQWVRHANSGSKNYEHPDLFMYVCAMDQIYSLINYAARIYGYARAASFTNRYIPVGILKSLGFDVDNITGNLADFRYKLNSLITKVSSMAVPNVFDIFKRHMLLAGLSIMDTPNDRGQMYLFQPTAIGKWSPKSSSKGSQLTYQPLTIVTTYDELISFIDDLINAVVFDEDTNIMSGDILKAYGEQNCIKLSYIPEDGYSYPVYDEEILEQIHNATVFINSAVSYTANVNSLISVGPLTQTNGQIYQDVTLTFSNSNTINMQEELNYMGCFKDHPIILDTYVSTPDYKTVINATRLKTSLTKFNNQSITTKILAYITCCTEVITDVDLIKFNDYSLGSISAFALPSFKADLSQSTTIQALKMWSRFDYAPVCYIATNSGMFIEPMGNFDTKTTVTADVLNRIHDMCTLSIFNVTNDPNSSTLSGSELQTGKNAGTK